MTDTCGSPAVTVVIPHFNRSELLGQTLRSLESQTVSAWEAIVVDDGSRPEEWACVQKYANQRIRVLQRTDGIKGPSRCRNIGCQVASAPLVLFLDSDDLLAPWCLEERCRIIDDLPAADAVIFPVLLFHHTPGDINRLWNRLDGADDLQRFLRSDPPWHTSSTIWRVSSLQKLNGFNENIMYGDDADLHIRGLFLRMNFSKRCAALPDVFIRRASAERITNTISDQLLASRRVRLREGTTVVKQFGNAEQQLTWQGQYFMECEFLLFQVPGSGQRIRNVLADWVCDWNPPQYRRWILNAYFSSASVCRHTCYLLLRIARRIVMLLLPECFFPGAGGFESEQLTGGDIQRLEFRLNQQKTLPRT